MELYKFHIHKFSPRIISQRMSVTGIFPAIAGDLESSSNSPSGKNHRLCAEDHKPASLSCITESTGYIIAILKQRDNRAFHMHLYPLVDAMVLQSADHFKARAITNMCEPGIFMTTKIPLKYLSVFSAIK